MSCASCSNNNGSGTPAGCRSNGNCGASGCEKLEVFDWLSDMNLPEGQHPFNWVEVRFKNNRKGFFKNAERHDVHVGDIVTVDAVAGYDVGMVTITGELVRVQMDAKHYEEDPGDIRKVRHQSTQQEIDKWHAARKLEYNTLTESRKIANGLGLEMKIGDVEYQGDKSKATFYYTADERVDFRELIKKLAERFKVRIEMRQIGARQEAAMLGGVGSCGRELCCTSWLTDFRSVTTSAARYQQLSLNPQKLAGQCGKLKCCLNYELDAYMEVVKTLPKPEIKLHTQKGIAVHFKTDIFQQKLWYMYKEPGANPVPIAADRVREIIEMNKAGKKPEDITDFSDQMIDVEVASYSKVESEDSLTRFDHKKSGKKGKRNSRKKSGKRNKHRQ